MSTKSVFELNKFKNNTLSEHYMVNNTSEYPKNIFERLGVKFNATEDNIKGFDYVCKDILFENEYKVIELRYKNKETFKNIGDTLNLSRQRIQQIEIVALNKIYDEMHKPNFTVSYTKLMLNKKIDTIFKEESHYLRRAVKCNKLPYDIRCKNLNSNEFLLLSNKLSQYESSLYLSVAMLRISDKIVTKLHKNDIYYIKDFIGMSFEDIMSIINLGKNVKYDLIEKLKEYDIIIGVDYYEKW